MRMVQWRRPNLHLRLSSLASSIKRSTGDGQKSRRQKGRRKRKDQAAAGHLEEEEPSSVASSIERSTGGGQKRKRKDPDFIEIGSGCRIGMLESIEGVLKCINSVVCFPQLPADGCTGFWPENVTLEEHRIAGLIYSHVCTYIILYHLEKKRTVDNISLIKDIVTLAGDGPLLTDCEFVNDTIRDVQSQLIHSTQPLLYHYQFVTETIWLADSHLEHSTPHPLVNSLPGHPTPQHPSVDRGTTDVSRMFNRLRDYALGRHKQEPMAVLHTLGVIGLARRHAPPEDGKEIMSYKQIRKQIVSFLLHAHTRNCFPPPPGYHALAGPFFQLHPPSTLCFVPPTLQLEVALEHLPEHHALFKEFTQRVTHHLSSPPTLVPVMFRDLLGIMAAKDASRSALLAWMPEQGSLVTSTRSACLDRIIDISRRIEPFGEQTPTEAEVRMYALIGEHIRSSIWLSTSRPLTDIGKSSCKVYLANASTDESDAHGQSREQLLEQIMPYLRALKSSCMDDVPSREEWKKYHAIWAWLHPGLLVCMSSRHMPHVDEEAGQVSELERKVSFIYNKVLGFIAAIKEGIPSVAAAVHHAMLPDQPQLSPQDALDCLIERADDAAAMAKEFVDGLMSNGTMAHIDHAVVMLAELIKYSEIFFMRLSHAVHCVDVKNVEDVEDAKDLEDVEDAKDRAMVASEVQNALDIICSEQPLLK